MDKAHRMPKTDVKKDKARKRIRLFFLTSRKDFNLVLKPAKANWQVTAPEDLVLVTEHQHCVNRRFTRVTQNQFLEQMGKKEREDTEYVLVWFYGNESPLNAVQKSLIGANVEAKVFFAYHNGGKILFSLYWDLRPLHEGSS